MFSFPTHMYIKTLSQNELDVLVSLLPNPKQKEKGRPRCNKKDLVEGILLHLMYSVPWNNIQMNKASGSSCYRYYREIQRRGLFKNIFKNLINGKLDMSNIAVDSSTITSFRYKSEVGFDGKHKKNGTKLSLITDAYGIPIELVTGKGNTHDLKLLAKNIQNTTLQRDSVINLDKGYTSVELRRQMRGKRVRVNMETKKGDYTRKRGRKFKVDYDKYKVRFKVEKVFGWLKSFKSIRTRKTINIGNFRGLIYLAIIIVVIRLLDF